jgi:hypothetical protein
VTSAAGEGSVIADRWSLMVNVIPGTAGPIKVALNAKNIFSKVDQGVLLRNRSAG